jgi:membrane-associated protein
MHWLSHLIDIVLHLDKHLNALADEYKAWTYLILFGIIFAETGLVVTPFLPGDSLLFAVGSLAATSGSPLGIGEVFATLLAAAVLGNTANYHIGRAIGPRALKGGRFVKKAYLDRTHQFFEKRGGKTIVLTRFVPILRTFAPFVAGIGGMSYARFQAFNIAGGLAWVGLILFAGYFFGKLIPEGKFAYVTLAIIVISVIPIVFDFWKARRELAAERAKPPATNGEHKE